MSMGLLFCLVMGCGHRRSLRSLSWSSDAEDLFDCSSLLLLGAGAVGVISMGTLPEPSAADFFDRTAPSWHMGVTHGTGRVIFL